RYDTHDLPPDTERGSHHRSRRGAEGRRSDAFDARRVDGGIVVDDQRPSLGGDPTRDAAADTYADGREVRVGETDGGAGVERLAILVEELNADRIRIQHPLQADQELPQQVVHAQVHELAVGDGTDRAQPL